MGTERGVTALVAAAVFKVGGRIGQGGLQRPVEIRSNLLRLPCNVCFDVGKASSRWYQAKRWYERPPPHPNISVV